MRRRRFIALFALSAALPGIARAHHGWRWTEGAEFTLDGTIRAVRLGNPHGLLEVEAADGAMWTAELGQPWRNAQAGLPEDALRPGVAVTLEGHRSADPDDLRIKAERVILAGVVYDLYPDRT